MKKKNFEFLNKILGQYFYDTKEHCYVKKNRFFENLESKSPLNIFTFSIIAFFKLSLVQLSFVFFINDLA